MRRRALGAWRRRLETLFLRYGAGSAAFDALTGHRLWSRVSWILIGAGIGAWGLFFWLMAR